MIKASRHETVSFWEKDDNVVWQGKVTYTRPDAKKVTIDSCNVFYMKDGLRDQYLIYIDNAPLFV